MGDQDDRRAGGAFPQFPPDLSIRFGIHSRERIIKNHDRRAAHQHPGNGRSLLLSAGEGDAPLTDKSIISIRKALNSLVQAGNFGSPPDLAHARFLGHELLFLGLRNLIAGIPFLSFFRNALLRSFRSRVRHSDSNIFHQGT